MVKGDGDELDCAILVTIERFVGARTGAIAFFVREKRPKVLRRLRKMEAAGLVYREPRYTAPNDIYWITPYVPLSDPLKAEPQAAVGALKAPALDPHHNGSDAA